MTISINLIYGYTGQLSLGHAAFLGIGAYSFTLLTVNVGLNFWLAFIIAIIIVGITAALVGYPAFRLKGAYFILVTLGFAIIIHVVLLAWVDLTGGANGIRNIPRPPEIPLPFGTTISFKSALSIYYLILFFLILILFINSRLIKSLVGKTFIAISWNEDLAQSLGINTTRNKVLSFTISAMFAAVAGILYATYNSVISPGLAHFTEGVFPIVYLVVGGVGTMAGPIIGTMVLVVVPEILQSVLLLKTLSYGVILLLFVIFLPSGIVGNVKLLLAKVKRTRESSRRKYGIT